MFDLDHTLVKPKNGNIFPKTFDDFQLLFENTKSRL